VGRRRAAGDHCRTSLDHGVEDLAGRPEPGVVRHDDVAGEPRTQAVKPFYSSHLSSPVSVEQQYRSLGEDGRRYRARTAASTRAAVATSSSSPPWGPTSCKLAGRLELG